MSSVFLKIVWFVLEYGTDSRGDPTTRILISFPFAEDQSEKLKSEPFPRRRR